MINTYRFKINVGTGYLLVNPIYGDATKNVKSEYSGADGYFFRDKLSGKFTLVRGEYDLIDSAPFDTTFLFLIEKKNSAGTYDTFFEGQFNKTNCKFDQDGKRVEFQVETTDRYRNVVGGLNKQYSLLDLGPQRTAVTYTKQPLLQIYLPGSNFINNFLSGVHWEQEIETPVFEGTELVSDFKFFKGKGILFVTGNGEIDPDVSGYYDYISRISNNNLYSIVEVLQTGLLKWQIEDITGTGANIYYEGELDDPIFGTAKHRDAGTIFNSNTTSDRCRAYEAVFYCRLLTDIQNNSVLGINDTDPIQEDDMAGSDNYGYQYVLGVDIQDFIATDQHTTDSEGFPLLGEDAVNFQGEYFKEYIPPIATGINQAYPISLSDWNEVSYWLYYSSVTEDLQTDWATPQILRNAYKLSACISALLTEIDPSITHDGTVDYSQFLYSDTNPVSSDPQPIPIITPKANITLGEYNQPAQNSNIRLQDILTMLWQVYRCQWFIDSDNRFRIEHVSFFENGGSYSALNIGVDLTTLTEPKTGKPWGYGTNQYTYEKSNMPERREFSWMDDVSPPFEGYPIEIRSGYVQSGNIEKNETTLFTTDLDYMLAQSQDISGDGFALLGAFQDGNATPNVPFLTHAISVNKSWKMQNGYLSNVYLHDKYHTHSAAAQDITVNKNEIISTTIKRNKIQSLEFHTDSAIDPMKLIKTGLGVGQFSTIEETLTHGGYKVKIKHDTT